MRVSILQLYFVIATGTCLLVHVPASLAATTEIAGTLETEISKDTDFDGVNSSGITQATMELGLDTKLSDTATSHIVLLYEDDGDNPLNVDAAFIELHSDKTPWHIYIGQQYLPFGWFESNMVSDPLTLELGETSEPAFTFSYENDYFAKIYMAKGTVAIANKDDNINHFGVSLGYTTDNVNVGVDYTNNIGESNNAGDIIAQDPTVDSVGANGTIEKAIAGGAAHIGLNMGTFHFFGEIVFAQDDFAASEVRSTLAAKPSANNVEFALDVGNKSAIAIGAQSTVDMESFGLPAKRVLFAYTTEFESGIGFGLELRSDKNYTTAASSGSKDTAKGITMQFSAAF